MEQALLHNHKTFVVFAIFWLSFSLHSCVEKPVFAGNEKVATTGWDVAKPVLFEVAITDTITAHDMLIHVRNTPEYAYQNFWMFVESSSPSGVVQKDTLECILADNAGKWLGKGVASTREISVMYFEKIRFPEKGTYTFSISQGMRNISLVGIESIGLSILKEKENGEK